MSARPRKGSRGSDRRKGQKGRDTGEHFGRLWGWVGVLLEAGRACSSGTAHYGPCYLLGRHLPLGGQKISRARLQAGRVSRGDSCCNADHAPAGAKMGRLRRMAPQRRRGAVRFFLSLPFPVPQHSHLLPTLLLIENRTPSARTIPCKLLCGQARLPSAPSDPPGAPFGLRCCQAS